MSLIVIGENVERDAVHKALMSLLRQDIKSEFFPAVESWNLYVDVSYIF